MISEVLPYLILITCILIRVSSKEVNWTVLDTSPKLGQGLTLFCEVDNCAVHETKRWHGGPDKKPLMSNSGISTDKTKYSTSIVQNGFILTILNLTVKDLNINYTCSCGLVLDKHILYIEDIYTVDNLNKSTNGTNYVGTNDARGIILKITLPLLLVIILFVVFIVVMKKRGTLKRLKEMFCGCRIKKSDEDGNTNVTELLLHDIEVESNQRRSLDEDGNTNETESSLHDVGVESNQRRNLDEDGNTNETGSSLHDVEVESNQRRNLDEDGNINETESSLHDVEVESNQRRNLDEDGNTNETESLLHDVEVESNQRRNLDEDGNTNETESLLHDVEVESNQRRNLDEDGNTNVTESLLFDDEVESNQRRSLVMREVHEKIEALTLEKEECIPYNILELDEDILNSWKKDYNMFVSTRASERVFRCLGKKPSVTVVGNPGVGKTATMRYVALKMRNDGYTVVPTCKAEDIINFPTEGKKTLFVIDDICGQYTVDPYRISRWHEMSEEIQQLLKNEYCKIISTCRLQIFNEVKLRRLPFFKYCECDLNSSDLCLTFVERRKIAQKYFEDKADQVNDLLEEYDFFPLLCGLFQKRNCARMKSFFRNPFEFYKEKIDYFSNSDDKKDKYKTCALALCAIFNNRFKEEYLTKKNNDIQVVIESTLLKCKLSKDSSFKKIHDALDTLEGTFVVKVDEVYRAIHDKLYDFLAHYFGEKMTELIIERAQSEFISDRFLWKTTDNSSKDIDFTIIITDDQILDKYTERVIRDWDKGEVYAVFTNRNIKSPSFNANLITHLNRRDQSYQVKLANMTDERSQDSTLLQSCFVGDPKLTQWILKYTFDDDSDNVDISYIRHGDIDVVNKCRNNGTSPLAIACEYGHTEIVEMLLRCKADINKCQHDGQTPLFRACQNVYAKVLDILVKHDADIHKSKKNGASPLLIACQYGHLPIVRKLLKCGARVNKCMKGNTSPLFLACQNGHLNIVQELLDKKLETKIDKCINIGVSPLYIACQHGHDKIVKHLLKHGADINKCKDDGTPPLQIACCHNQVEVVKELLANPKVDIDLCDNDKCTSLYWACNDGYTDIVRILLEHHANPRRRNKKGNSPFDAAQQKDCKDILDIIKEHEIP